MRKQTFDGNLLSVALNTMATAYDVMLLFTNENRPLFC